MHRDIERSMNHRVVSPVKRGLVGAFLFRRVVSLAMTSGERQTDPDAVALNTHDRRFAGYQSHKSDGGRAFRVAADQP